jgi:hypothetical protein
MLRRPLAQLGPKLVVGVLPMLVLSIGVARFVLHHFFVRAPFLLDSGFYSALVYRAGLSPPNPNIAIDFADHYFAFHFSPLISTFSVLSYAQPLPRIEWYALFQAVVFAPIGLAVFAGTARQAGHVPLRFFAALAFSLSGMVVVFVAAPHYEPAIPGFICLLLAAIVAGRTRLAWCTLALALSVREDAGMHAALALLPLVYLGWRGRDIGLPLRIVVYMAVAGIGWLVFSVVLQKLFFHAQGTLGHVYLGSPPFSHLSVDLIAARAHFFLTDRPFIYLPFLATVVLAAVRRDAGYVLGWAISVPWFVLNFLAFDPEKAAFNAYTGFPFIVAIFWVLIYGMYFAPAPRRLRPALLYGVFTVTCLTSTIGLYWVDPAYTTSTLKDMYFHRSMRRDAVHGFVAALQQHRADFGRIYIDQSIGALALETFRYADTWQPGRRELDALAFHHESWSMTDLAPDIFANDLRVCTRARGTGLIVCTREPLPATTFAEIETVTIPAVFAFGPNDRPNAFTDRRGIVLRDKAFSGGFLGRLAKGRYALVFTLSGPSDAGVEVYADGHSRGSATTSSAQLELAFDADGENPVAFRISSHVAGEVVITAALLHQL